METIALDDWLRTEDISAVAALKLDIEGSELLAVQGAESLLRRFRPVVLCEFNAPALNSANASCLELLKAFTDLGYSPATLQDGAPAPVSPDVCPTQIGNLLLLPS